MLANIATHAMLTPQRREAFRKAQKSDSDEEGEKLYALMKQNATRWNGTYEMITRGECSLIISYFLFPAYFQHFISSI